MRPARRSRNGADRASGSDQGCWGSARKARELAACDPFDLATTGRVMALQVLTHTPSVVGSYLLFEFVPLAGS
ncbi:hypothetical protein BRC77_11275 [Halobacteriales archaeon QH_8_64_26]|nr:MAG: hypothetical protein BRC77_11275 [Halobacteriales archaeon QH_8_64_26]